MVPLTALWLPIVLSAVIVFLASWVLHSVLGYHRRDFSKLPDEERILATMREAGVEAGAYLYPHAASPGETRSPEMIAKYEQGPVGTMQVRSGPPSMGRSLVQWFVYCLVVGVFVAYLAGRTVAPGAEYLGVFRVAGTTAFLAYAGAVPIQSIWMGKSWGSTARDVFDGLVYGLLTAGVFGWLWPA